MVKENHKPVLIVIAGPNGSGNATMTLDDINNEIRQARKARKAAV